MHRGLAWLLVGVVVACSSSSSTAPGVTPEGCPTTEFRFAHGSADGHADPFGARAAGQARAGRVRDASQIVQGPLARNRVRVGDFALANDKIALYIEAEGRREGYAPFGGDVTAIDTVGDDGRPRGLSTYGETLITFSRQAIRPDRVSVLADGSDGKAAIVRVSGVMENIPFLDIFAPLSPAEYGLPAALDYVLEPGAERVVVRLNVANPGDAVVDFGNLQRVGFFQSSRAQTFTPQNGFAPPQGETPWVGFESTNGAAFSVRGLEGTMRSELEVSGFHLWSLAGGTVEACATKTTDYLELLTVSTGIDGLLEARRRVDGAPAWRTVTGTVKEAETGAALGGGFVHGAAADGTYLTRVRTDEAGAYTVHVPEGALLTPTLQGWPVPAAAAGPDLLLPRRAVLDVKVTDETTGEALPSRIQVLPVAPPAPAPAQFGLREEIAGRLWQEYTMSGSAALPVPPGQHRVVVSRGYGYELVDTTVTAPATVDAKLRRAVPAAGVLCADFHEHSFFSADSSDPVVAKVKGAIADGLEIPVSSEHEWVVDFGPVVRDLGMTRWAFGMASSELTTFTWGHFGLVPMVPQPELPNNGAIDWVGKTPPTFLAEANALPSQPVVIVNHPRGTGFQAYFTAAGFDRATANGNAELWTEAFGAVEVFNDSDFDTNRAQSVADWFALLDAGKNVWAVGNSDSHDQRNTFVGYPRTCLRFGFDDPARLTPELVRDALRSGAATVNGGLSLDVTGPGGVRPGGTSTAGDYQVVITSPSWIAATELEVIVDGATTQTLPLTRSGDRYEATVPIAAAQSRPRHWVVFHVRGAGDLAPLHPGKKPFAVSNPIFF